MHDKNVSIETWCIPWNNIKGDIFIKCFIRIKYFCVTKEKIIPKSISLYQHRSHINKKTNKKRPFELEVSIFVWTSVHLLYVWPDQDIMHTCVRAVEGFFMDRSSTCADLVEKAVRERNTKIFNNCFRKCRTLAAHTEVCISSPAVGIAVSAWKAIKADCWLCWHMKHLRLSAYFKWNEHLHAVFM